MTRYHEGMKYQAEVAADLRKRGYIVRESPGSRGCDLTAKKRGRPPSLTSSSSVTPA